MEYKIKIIGSDFVHYIIDDTQFTVEVDGLCVICAGSIFTKKGNCANCIKVKTIQFIEICGNEILAEYVW